MSTATPAPKSDTRTQDITSAFKEGMLLAHMMEFSYEGTHDHALNTMFKVMANKPNITHHAYAGNVYESTPDGMRGMPTTVLHEGQEGNVWDNVSSIGVLFDGRDSKNIKLEQFYPYDAESAVNKGRVTYMSGAFHKNKMQEPLYSIVDSQFDKQNPLVKIEGDDWHLNLNDNMAVGRHQRTETAIRAFWRARTNNLLPNYKEQSINYSPEHIPFMNEVTISAKLAGVKGIVVKTRLIGAPDKAQVQKAQALAQWLSETFPDIIPTPPPVMLYNGTRIALANEQEQQTSKPNWLSSIASSTSWLRQ